jgi:hypothetical protein
MTNVWDNDCYIWSNEHRAWWGPGQHGYAKALDGAGVYPLHEALDICTNAIPTARETGMISEVPVRVNDLKQLLARYPLSLPREITG